MTTRKQGSRLSGTNSSLSVECYEFFRTLASFADDSRTADKDYLKQNCKILLDVLQVSSASETSASKISRSATEQPSQATDHLKKELRPPSLKTRKSIQSNFDEDEFDFWDFFMRKRKARNDRPFARQLSTGTNQSLRNIIAIHFAPNFEKNPCCI